MPDYQEMYFKLFRASEDAINLITKAQQECEELYINSKEAQLVLLKPKVSHDND